MAEYKDTQLQKVSDVFSRVICGVDGFDGGSAAVAAVAEFAPRSADVFLCGVWAHTPALALGTSSTLVRPPFSTDAEIQGVVHAAAMSLAHRQTHEVVIDGPPGPALLHEALAHDATLVAVGSHGQRRATGILLGGVATVVLHDAPSSVLIARATVRPTGQRPTIRVGVDGSDHAARAAVAAAKLATRIDADLQAVAVGDQVDVDPFNARITSDGQMTPVRQVDGDAVSVLTEPGASLVVVGSRGLRGLRSLGSVSERVAHEAGCSVLVVREPWKSSRP